MYIDAISTLLNQCRVAHAAGLSRDQICERILDLEIPRLLNRISPQQFLDWIKDDHEFGYFYYDVQQSGVCAKPQEAAALILEHIALDAIE